MIEKNHFLDNCSREFIPYKGFCKILGDGSYVKDENTSDSNGPFELICDPISHGNWHTLYNLMDSNGKKLLPKGIRSIKYYGDFYLLEDNNEDELINSRDVKGGFSAAKYCSLMNVMRIDGTLLLEDWVNRIDLLGDYFCVHNDRRVFNISLSGDFFDKGIFSIKFGHTIKPKNNSYTIFNSLYDVIVEDYTSVMWSSEEFWKVELLHNGTHSVYLYGEGNEMIYYAHEILTNPTVLALVERECVWYAVSIKGNLTKKFKWEPWR